MASRSPIISHQEWKKIEWEIFNHISVRATDHQSRALGGRKQTRVVGDFELSGNRLTKMASTIHGRIIRRIVKFDQLTWKYNRKHFSFRASSCETDFEQSREKTRITEYGECYEGAMQNKSERSGGQNQDCRAI